ncbi:MAG: BMP family ABC transporter substrate-binding protein [Treponema sp.]|nr:BMP family ABC transporter substrate-binding protein [Treponema sp.]
MKKLKFLLLFAALLMNCKAEKQTTIVGVFVPGVIAGSPIYEMMAQGVQKACAEKNISVTVVEAGYNQAEWEPSLTSMSAGGRYALIVSSNPSLPAIAVSVSAKFPKQKFLLLDGELAGNPSVYTLRYDQYEQFFMAGSIAGLVTMECGGEKKVGLLAGQEYPTMNEIILPAYLEGTRAIATDFNVDFRVLGNWFDAGKAAEIAIDMFNRGSYVILCVAGGANEGVVQTAAERGTKVVWADTNGYGVRPGVVIGSSVVHQDKAAYEKTRLFLEGGLPFGEAEMVGVKDGYVEFIQNDANYISAVSEAVRTKQMEIVEGLLNNK